MNPTVAQENTSRSKCGTFSWRGLDWSGFSLRSGWDTVEAFGRRVCGIAALALVCAALNPVWLPSQTPLQYKLEANMDAATKRLDSFEAKFASVPTDIAVMKEQISRQNEQIESFSNRFWALIIGLLAWFAREMFREFGGREKRKA